MEAPPAGEEAVCPIVLETGCDDREAERRGGYAKGGLHKSIATCAQTMKRNARSAIAPDFLASALIPAAGGSSRAAASCPAPAGSLSLKLSGCPEGIGISRSIALVAGRPSVPLPTFSLIAPMQREHVIFFRHPSTEPSGLSVERDPYEAAMTSDRYIAHTQPVLGQEFVNENRLVEVLGDPEAWRAVVATSKRAGEAWSNAVRCRNAGTIGESKCFSAQQKGRV